MPADTFKLYRKLSLVNEVDGIWEALEHEEDNIVPQHISVNECQALRRTLVNGKNELGDILPTACKMLATSRTNTSFFTADSPDTGKWPMLFAPHLSIL